MGHRRCPVVADPIFVVLDIPHLMNTQKPDEAGAEQIRLHTGCLAGCCQRLIQECCGVLVCLVLCCQWCRGNDRAWPPLPVSVELAEANARAQTVPPAEDLLAGLADTSLTGLEPAGHSPQTGQPSQSPEGRNYFVPSRGIGTTREPEPLPYVRSLKQIEIFQDAEADWLLLGLDYRFRYEYRNNDLRRPIAIRDEPLLTRSRAFLGVKQKWDPLRGAIEFEDARRTNSHFPEDNRDVNEAEIIQAYGELYFDDALGENRPLRLQYGRLAFEYVDRRLISRNQWRNTTNNFQGYRAILGKEENDWQLDLLAVQPMQRLLSELDRADDDVWFYGLLGAWRGWSEVITLEPYYLVLDQQASGTRVNREIHTLGLRGYGVQGETGWDYDAQVIFQFGRHDQSPVQAFASTLDVGYRFEQDWQPRISGFLGYASGDQDPGDSRYQRFDRLYGFSRPWSNNDYVIFENVIAPKLRFEFRPVKKLRAELGYGAFWLASASDAWTPVNLHDPTGQSGRLMGQELEMRYRFPVGKRTQMTLGYLHFFPGQFPRNTGKPFESDFFYMELAPQLLR